MEDVLIDFLVVQINNIRVQMSIVIIFYIAESWLLDIVLSLQNMADSTVNHGERGEPKNIKLNKTHGLQVADILSLSPGGLADAL